MKTRPLLLAVLCLALSGCSREEPPPAEDPEETNTPPSSVTISRPGPGRIGGTEPGTQPLETLDAPEARRDTERLASPYIVTNAASQPAAIETATTEHDEGFFLYYDARRADETSFDSYRFTPSNDEFASCRFDSDFNLLSCRARFSPRVKPVDRRLVSFSIEKWEESRTTYVYPWRSYHPRQLRNTPDQKNTPFSLTFKYVLPDGKGAVQGVTRMFANQDGGGGFANEECSECTISVNVDRLQQTVRGEFSCVRLWTYANADESPPYENGPISITGEFYLPYTQD